MPNVKRIDARPNISREIADEVRRRIVDGDLAPGQRINEVHLSAGLGVSRTPLREALSALVAEGALQAQPRRGFFVTPLSRRELEDIYPIRAILDPAALRLAGLPDAATMARLEDLNARLGKERNVEKRIRLDDDLHLALVSGCGNAALLDLIRQFIRRTHRYEYGYLKDPRNLERATGEHRRILQALKRRDLDGACAWLKQNMESGREPLTAWLEAQ